MGKYLDDYIREVPVGRPKTRDPEAKTTSLSLNKEERIAVRRLQLHREAKGGPTNLRDLLIEGLVLLLADEGLEPMRQPETVPVRTVVEITKR